MFLPWNDDIYWHKILKLMQFKQEVLSAFPFIANGAVRPNESGAHRGDQGESFDRKSGSRDRKSLVM